MNLPKTLSLYADYKTNWMVEHGYTIDDLIKELDDYREETEEDSEYNSIQDVMNEWELESGFGGEIWPCYDEWFDNDFYEELEERIEDKLEYQCEDGKIILRTPVVDVPTVTLNMEEEDDVIQCIADFIAFGEHKDGIPMPDWFHNAMITYLWIDDSKGVNY